VRKTAILIISTWFEGANVFFGCSDNGDFTQPKA